MADAALTARCVADLHDMDREQRELVARLRGERDQARTELCAARAELASSESKAARLRELVVGGGGCAVLAGVRGWALEVLLPALAAAIYGAPSLGHGLLVAITFVAVYSFSTDQARRTAQSESAATRPPPARARSPRARSPRAPPAHGVPSSSPGRRAQA